LNGRRRVGVAAVVDRSHGCLAVRRLVWSVDEDRRYIW